MSTQGLQVHFITHACVRIEGQFGGLLTDPWLLNEPVYNFTTWKYPAAILPPEQVSQGVRYVYFSHAHEDHFHIPSIDRLSRELTILLPLFPNKPCLRSYTMERVLREMGFHHIRMLMPWQTIELGEGCRFTLIPACKTKYWDWENSGFILQQGEETWLNLNDCPTDLEICEEIRRRFGPIDLAFLQYSGVSMFPGRYRMPVEEMRAASGQRKHSWVQQRTVIEQLDVKRIAPFAGDFCWLDDRLFHCNWANRSTPALFERFVSENYPERKIEVLIMYPTDSWSRQAGMVRRHPPVDWDHYVDAITRLKALMQPKVERIQRWLDDSDVSRLELRSRAYTEHLNRWIFQRDIDFTARIRLVVEGPQAGFSFVMKADPGHGFCIDWEDKGVVDQTLYVRQAMWASILVGKVMMNTLQWDSESEQHVPYTLEIGRFWFWFEMHIDLNNRNPQAAVDRVQHPDRAVAIDPLLGVYPLEDEWQRVRSIS